ncbi:MAG: O-antigen ligase family protein [Gloeobacteraceae cyanobacterium ES-bin-316]|nr:O-antigen ligase family protein [Ferruginibacter sp.]
MATEYIHISSKIHSWVKKELIQKKFLSPWGVIFLILMSVAGGFLAANDLFFVPIALGILLVGIGIIYYCLFKPLIGFYIIIFAGFFIFYPNHLLGKEILPLSTGLEILILFLFLGTFISTKSGDLNPSGGLLKTFVSITFLILTLYIAVQAFNPNVRGYASWFPVFKRSIVFVLIYIAAYRIIDTTEKFRFFSRFWIVLSLVTAVYGCFQQWFGYLPMEMNYILSTPGGLDLLFQGGQLRKFSILSDVVSFGVLCASMALFTLIIAINEKEKWRKYRLFLFSVIMLLGMAYSGTRTATIILPAGFILYGLITIQNKTTLVALFVSVLVFMAVMFAPIYSNPSLNRVRSTFDSKDASLNVRDKNRHYIQPYLHSHPIGGGIGTSNFAGYYNHPYHPLAGFATDSAFLKVGLEYGWIGLIFMMLFNLAILYQGIYYYFKIRDDELRLYVVAIVCTLFPLIVTQYAQETVGQFPAGIFFFSSLSLMKRLLEFDQRKNLVRSAGDDKLMTSL